MKYHWVVSVVVVVCFFIFSVGCDFLENGNKRMVYNVVCSNDLNRQDYMSTEVYILHPSTQVVTQRMF